MKLTIKQAFLAVGTAALAYSCSKISDVNTPLSGSGGVPTPVTNVSVKNDSAIATISYALPKVADLAYIKAVYNLSEGRVREVKASMYDNKLVVDGFGDTLEHEVKLYAVNRAEVASEPVTVIVKPLENPIWGVFRNLEVMPDFAGIRIKSKNPSKFNVAIEVLRDSMNQWFPFSGIYTSVDSINSPLRGMDTIPQKLAVVVRDRFLNRTDTLFTTLVPFYEAAIPKNGYREFTLPGDSPSAWASNRVSNLWDGYTELWPYVNITTDQGKPSQITFEIGRLAQLSRIVIWDYPEYLNSGRGFYYGGNLRKFEVWASPNPPLDGSFNNWTLMGDFESVKPSGLPYGQITADDRALGFAGFNWDLRADVSKMRYIRIVCKQNWAGSYFMALGELQLYGDPR